jgi:hypothetical protein
VSAVETVVKSIASDFDSYLNTAILDLSIDTLDAIMSSDSLRIIDEDCLLNVLLEVGVDSSFLCGHLPLEY